MRGEETFSTKPRDSCPWDGKPRALELIIQPQCAQWRELIERGPVGSFQGKDLAEWRAQTRAELGLAIDRAIIATGHQTLLWHPGILAKYLVADSFAAGNQLATANLVVDQHVGEFGAFDVPVRKQDGSLGVETIRMCEPVAEVPMGRHPAFEPPPPPRFSAATASVRDGVLRIFEAVRKHCQASNAAAQMAAAVAGLMSPCVRPMPDVTATDLMKTSLARALLREMLADPKRCAQCYNSAVANVPDSDVNPLSIREPDVELPLWRIEGTGQRMPVYARELEDAAPIDLLPRALFMTALVRLGLCDLFIHGTGGANYDRAMEAWTHNWLGLRVAPIAVVTANLRLPLGSGDESLLSVSEAINHARRLWHDPQSATSAHPSQMKRKWLQALSKLPRNSPEREAAFLAMHVELADSRSAHEAVIEQANAAVVRAKRKEGDEIIASRRDWAFPLYPTEMIDDLAVRAKEEVSSA